MSMEHPNLGEIVAEQALADQAVLPRSAVELTASGTSGVVGAIVKTTNELAISAEVREQVLTEAIDASAEADAIFDNRALKRIVAIARAQRNFQRLPRRPISRL